MPRGSAQTAGDLGFAVQFNVETPWYFAQLRLFKATAAYTSACTDALAPQSSGVPRVATGNPPEDYGQIQGGCSFSWMIAVD